MRPTLFLRKSLGHKRISSIPYETVTIFMPDKSSRTIFKTMYYDSKLLKNADKSLLTKSIASSGLSSMLSLIKRKIAP